MLNFKTVNSLAFTLLVGLIVAYFLLGISFWWLLLLGSICFCFTALGSGLIGWNYHIKAFNCHPTISKSYVAITFEDGHHPVFTPHVLKLLEQYQVKATFFCVGLHIDAYPALLRIIINQGHPVGN